MTTIHTQWQLTDGTTPPAVDEPYRVRRERIELDEDNDTLLRTILEIQRITPTEKTAIQNTYTRIASLATYRSLEKGADA